MKRLLVCACLCVAMSFATLAQRPATDSVERYVSDFARLGKLSAKNPASVEALYGYAMFYFDNSHPLRNLPLAMIYIRQAEERHLALLQGTDMSEVGDLARKGITISSLRQAKQAIATAAQNTVEVRTDMTAKEIDAYLEVFGNDEQMVRMLRERRFTQVYNDDLAIGTAESYYHFIESYPGTTEAEQMERRLSELAPSLVENLRTPAEVDAVAERYAMSPSVMRAAAKCRSRMAYAKALEENTHEAYKRFLQLYPSSDESMQARSKLDAMVVTEYHSLRTTKELADFIDSNADNELADSAMLQIRHRIRDNHDMEAVKIYLKRYKFDPQYNDIYNLYYSWHAAEGNGGPIKDFYDNNPDYPYMHVVEEDLDFADRVDHVYLLADFFESEYPRYADFVKQLMGKRISFVPMQRTLQNLVSSHNYKAALDRVRQFEICFENVAHDEYVELQQLIAAPQAVRPAAMDFSSKHHVMNPVVNQIDGNLYYTSGMADRKISYASRKGNKWVAGGDAIFNNAENKGLTLFGFFAGGKRMLLGHGGDIWIAEREEDGWRIAEIPPYPVNTDYVETDAYMLPDGSGMLLASDRPNGMNLQPSGSYFHGDTALATDLYFIPYTRQGWGEAINLGPDINSIYCERSPVMSRNMQTLYFVTDGRGGFGYGDIYTATRSNTSDWVHWSKLKNLGKEVNSGFNEVGLSLSPDEKTLHFSSNPSMGLFSAYSVSTLHDVAPSFVTTHVGFGSVGSDLNRVRLADLKKQAVIQTIDCSDKIDSVSIRTDLSGQYVLFADAGSLFVPATNLRVGMVLRGYSFADLVATDRPLPLEAVEFAPDSDELTPLARLQMEQIALFVRNQPSAVVELTVDVTGRDDAACYELSLRRGESLRESLVVYGIENSRIIVSAYGNLHTKTGAAAKVAVKFRER